MFNRDESTTSWWMTVLKSIQLLNIAMRTNIEMLTALHLAKMILERTFGEFIIKYINSRKDGCAFKEYSVGKSVALQS